MTSDQDIITRLDKISLIMQDKARGLMVFYDLMRSYGVKFDGVVYRNSLNGTQYRVTVEIVKSEDDDE